MLSLRALSLAVALILGASLAVVPAAAADKLAPACVPLEVQSGVTQCPAGLKHRQVSAERKPVFQAKPPPPARKKPRQIEPPNDTSWDGIDNLRDRRLPRRAQDRLLISTIMGLERLLKTTPDNSPDRPMLLRRTAEEYVTLRQRAHRQRIIAEDDLRKARRKKDATAIRKAKGELARHKKLEETARKKAIGYYTLLKRDYPRHPKLDEVLYYLAFELEQGNEHEKARKVYFELIQKAPQSKYVPAAYLAFGELFFVEAQADPSKWTLAEQAYTEVIKYPAPQNRAHGYARYKLAYVYWNQGSYPDAISEMKRVIEFGTKHTRLPGARQLMRAARRDLVPLYAASGRPDRAYAFFKPLSGDTGSNDDKTLDMLNELGLAYLDTGHYEDAIVVFTELMRRDRGDRWCQYQTRITEAVQATSSGNKPRIVKELDRQLAVLEEFRGDSRSEKATLKCANDTAALVTETAMSWHLETVGSGSVRGTGDEETMRLAAQLYDRMIDEFSAKEFGRFEFPRIVEADWPTMYKIKYARADLCYFSKDWECAAEAFTAAVEEDPNAPDAAEAAYAAALAYQKVYERKHAGDAAREGVGNVESSTWDRLKPMPLNDAQRNMITAFDRYLCIVDPQESASVAEQYAEIEYARARLYFEARHWEEAAVAFRRIALGRPRHDSAIYAAQLSLESLNVLRTHATPQRPACTRDIGSDVEAYLESFCENPKEDADSEQCAVFVRVSCDVDRLRAEELVRRADSGGTKNARELYQEAGDIYLGIWREHGEKQLRSGEAPACEGMDEVLTNLARSYQASHLLAKAIQARRILIDEQYGLHDTQLAKQALHDLGQNHQAIAMYDEAAGFFERYAAATKYRGEHSAEALSDAVVLRLGLGQDKEALADARTYSRHLGTQHPARAARIAYAIAAHHGERGEWREAQKHLRRAMAQIGRGAELDIKTQAHALLARTHVELGNTRQASREYAKVRQLWANPDAAAKEIRGAEGTKAANERRLGRALIALGEATYFVAEEQRRVAERVEFPVYRGPGTMAAVDRHIQTNVRAWIQRKKPLLEAATKAYAQVRSIEPHAPPPWVIASGARVGTLWSEFVREFRAAPIPDSIRRDDELRNAYYAALDKASEPFKLFAKSAFEDCLDYSVQYQYFDEHSRSCEVWLADNYKSDYHLLDEFRGAPNRANSASREQPPALRIGGEPLRAGR